VIETATGTSPEEGRLHNAHWHGVSDRDERGSLRRDGFLPSGSHGSRMLGSLNGINCEQSGE
jgi:hypothetical protein